MEKQELLQQIKNFANQGLIRKNEIIGAYDEGVRIGIQKTSNHEVSIVEILYFIGGFIVFLGISVLIWQDWRSLNIGTKIIATFGSGIAAYFVGLIFGMYKKLDKISQAFYFISALVTPIGLFVIFNHFGYNTNSSGVNTSISAILFAVFISSYLIFKKDIFIIFSIIFGTWLFFAFTSFLTAGKPYFKKIRFYEYRSLLMGLTYMLLGYFFFKTEKKSFSGWLYSFGVLFFLGAAFALSFDSGLWVLLFAGLVFGVIFLSVYVKSKSFLIFGSIFLMAYILRISSKYFSQELGWPLALVLAGLALIGVGYLTFYLNKKYISSSQTE